jgi:hypothetical protein
VVHQSQSKACREQNSQRTGMRDRRRLRVREWRMSYPSSEIYDRRGTRRHLGACIRRREEGQLDGRQRSLSLARRCRKAISRACCYYCCYVVVFEVCYLSLTGKPMEAGRSEGREIGRPHEQRPTTRGRSWTWVTSIRHSDGGCNRERNCDRCFRGDSQSVCWIWKARVTWSSEMHLHDLIAGHW